jgi:hypothetical protein
MRESLALPVSLAAGPGDSDPERLRSFLQLTNRLAERLGSVICRNTTRGSSGDYERRELRLDREKR